MHRPKLLDLFSGAGGCARGYQLAGFHVTGIDVNPQPRYAGDVFIEADAMTFPLDGFDAVHASPPCQDHTTARTTKAHGTGWMLHATIERLKASGLPYIVENVPGAAKHMPGYFLLCGESFGITGLCRHRLFLTSHPVMVPPRACRPHPVGIYGDLRVNDRRIRKDRGGMRAGVDTARRLLGCSWMDAAELTQAVPPVFTTFIGEQLITQLQGAAA